MRLPVKLSPSQGESIQGFIFRLAMKNGYWKLNDLVSLLVTRDGAKGLNVVENLSDTLGQRFDWTQHLQKDAYELTLPANIFAHPDTKICLKCMAENIFLAESWSSLMVSVCNTHLWKLRERCPTCSFKFKWDYNLLTHCSNCGQQWDQLEDQIRPIPAYQQAWNNSHDRRTLSARFYEALLQASRPRMIERDKNTSLAWRSDNRDSICEQAWRIIQSPHEWIQFQHMQLAQYPNLKFTAFDWFDPTVSVSPDTVTTFQTFTEYEFSVPKYLRNLVSGSDLNHSVTPLLAVKLLGMEAVWRVDSEQHKGPTGLFDTCRLKVVPALERIGLDPINPTQRQFHYRYQLAHLDAISECVSTASDKINTNLLWIIPNMTWMKRFDIEYVDLVIDGLSPDNVLEIFKDSELRFGKIGVAPNHLEAYLKQRLSSMLNGTVTVKTATKIIGKPSTYVRKLVVAGEIATDEVLPRINVWQAITKDTVLNRDSLNLYLKSNKLLPIDLVRALQFGQLN